MKACTKKGVTWCDPSLYTPEKNIYISQKNHTSNRIKIKKNDLKNRRWGCVCVCKCMRERVCELV